MGKIQARRRKYFLFYHPTKTKHMKQKLNSVLLIDDDEPTNYFNSLIIEETGCTDHIKVVQSGQKALEYLTTCDHSSEQCEGFPRPDLIFLDINMPAMNGWEFLEKYRQLKEEQKGRTIFVMLTTSLFSEDALKATRIPEISGFETKPLTAEVIHRICKKYFTDDPCSEKDDKENILLPHLSAS